MKKVFAITGMTCAACAAHVEKAVKKLDVRSVEVNLLMNRMTVDSDLTDDEIIKAVVGAGYGASEYGGNTAAPDKKSTDVADYSKTLLLRFIASMLFLVPLVYFSMGHMINFRPCLL